jgi:hypothetical protein
MAVKFITKSEVSAFTGIDSSKINDLEIWKANMEVQMRIEANGYISSKYKTNENLKYAALLFACETLSQQKKLQLVVGDITDERLGRIRIQRSRHPMFFFSRGVSGEALGMYDLLPHTTYRQNANKAIEYFMRDPDNLPDNSPMLFETATDTTKRGSGWDDDFASI